MKKILILLLFVLFTVGSAPPLAHSQLQLHDITPQNIIDATNKDRAANCLTTLTENVDLDKAAQLHANDMAAKSYFAHTNPQGHRFTYWMYKTPYQWNIAGENLAVHYDYIEMLEEAWMNSPSHKANIINPKYKNIGIGIAHANYEGAPSAFVVVMFAEPLKK